MTEPSSGDRPRAGVATCAGTPSSRQLLHRILLATDGTVTTILEAYADEPIEARRLAQRRRPAGQQDAEPLAVDPGCSVLDRHVLLCGARSGTTFLYGESLIVPDRLDPGIIDRLESTSQPIGALLRASRLETFREILAAGDHPAGSYARHFGTDEDAVLLYRTYRVLLRGQPIALVTEKLVAGGDEGDIPSGS